MIKGFFFFFFTEDKLLILGDFNIHVCCPSHHLEKESEQLIESFDLVQHVNGPTLERRHSLDLDLFILLAFYYVTLVLRKAVCLIMSVMFNVILLYLPLSDRKDVHYSRVITPLGVKKCPIL